MPSLTFAAALAFGGAVISADETAEWRIVPPEPKRDGLPGLPPLAVVEERNISENTWQLSGSVPGSLPIVFRDFSRCLQRQGWRLDKTIELGRASHKMNLLLWKKGKVGILLMLYDGGTARTGFALGTTDVGQQRSPKQGVARIQRADLIKNPNVADTKLRE